MKRRQKKITGIQIAHSFGRKPRQPIKPSRVFIYALAIAVLGGGGYLLMARLRRRKSSNNEPPTTSPSITINNALPATYSTSVVAASNAGKDSFPLKKGSKGTRVAQLQQALASIIGADKMNANGGIDGIFGKGTANALKLAGYPATVDEETFNQILSAAPSAVTVVFNPSAIATAIYKAARSEDIDGVLQALLPIKSPEQYSAVNEYYKGKELFGKTIVNDLLSYAFKDDESAKQKVRREFSRIGLVVDSSGKWSLQGLQLYNDLITLRATVVTDAAGNKIPVSRKVILGSQVKVSNGMTWFRSIDNTFLQVPTQDVTFN